MTITVDGVEYKAMTIFHPSYLLRNHSMADGSPRRLMQEDLRNIKNTILPDVDNVSCGNNITFGSLVNV